MAKSGQSNQKQPKIIKKGKKRVFGSKRIKVIKNDQKR